MSDMYIAGTYGSSISVDEPSSLVVALYLREVIGISELTAPEIPLLDPPSSIWPAWARRPYDGLTTLPDPFTGLLDREQTAKEWARWWRRAITAGPEAGDDLRPPRFSAFSATPSLRILLQLFHERAALWAEAISTDPLVKRAHSVPREGLEELAREAALRWRSPPFRLRLTVIPVQTEHAWLLAPDHILLTRHLIADRDNVLEWLRSRILALT